MGGEVFIKQHPELFGAQHVAGKIADPGLADGVDPGEHRHGAVEAESQPGMRWSPRGQCLKKEPKLLGGLGVPIIHSEDSGPCGPGVAGIGIGLAQPGCDLNPGPAWTQLWARPGLGQG